MKKKFTSILFIWVIVSTCTFTIAYGAPNHKDGLQKILGLSRNKRDKYEIENSSSVVEDNHHSSRCSSPCCCTINNSLRQIIQEYTDFAMPLLATRNYYNLRSTLNTNEQAKNTDTKFPPSNEFICGLLGNITQRIETILYNPTPISILLYQRTINRVVNSITKLLLCIKGGEKQHLNESPFVNYLLTHQNSLDTLTTTKQMLTNSYIQKLKDLKNLLCGDATNDFQKALEELNLENLFCQGGKLLKGIVSSGGASLKHFLLSLLKSVVNHFHPPENNDGEDDTNEEGQDTDGYYSSNEKGNDTDQIKPNEPIINDVQNVTSEINIETTTTMTGSTVDSMTENDSTSNSDEAQYDIDEDTLSSSGSGESSQNSESQDKSGDDTAESSDSSSPELPSDAIEIILRCLEKILSISPDGAIEFDSLVQINAPIPCNPSSGKDCVLTSSINNDIMLQSVLPAIRAINDVLPGTNIDPGLILNNDSLSKVLPRYRNMLVMALYPLNYLAKHANLFDFVTNTTSNASTESRASAKPGSDEDTKSVTDSSSLSTLSGVNHSGSPWDVLVHRSSTPSKTSTVTPSSASTTSSNLASNLPASQIHSSASTPGVTSHSIITQSTSPANVAKNGTASPHNLSRTLLGLNSDMNSSNQSSNSSSSEADSSSMSPEIIDSLCQCA